MLRKLCWVAGLLLAVLLVGCDGKSHTVRYEVDGTAARKALSYRNATGADEQIDVRSTWRLSFSAKTGEYVGVSVFNATGDGTVTCRLYVDNRLIKRATSVGGYKTARCDALAGWTNQPTPTRGQP